MPIMCHPWGLQVLFAVILGLFAIDHNNKGLSAQWVQSWSPGYISSVCVFTITFYTSNVFSRYQVGASPRVSEALQP